MPEPWRFAQGRPPDVRSWLGDLGAELVAVCAWNHPDVAALLGAAAAVGVDLALVPRELPAAAVRHRLAQLGDPPLVSDREDLADHRRCVWPEVGDGRPVTGDGRRAMGDGRRATTGDGRRAMGPAGLLVAGSGSTDGEGWHRLSWGAVTEAAVTQATACGMLPGQAWLCCLPLAHVGGAMQVFRAAAAGADLVLCRRFAAAAVSDILDGEGIVGASLVPTMLHRLVDHRAGRPFPATLEHLIVGGAACDDRLRAASTALGCTPRLTYGLTETCAMVTLQTPAEAAAGPGCGRALSGRAVRIREARSTTSHDGRAVPAGAIQVRTPTTGGGWYPTGDHGWMLPDGQLQVSGRISTRIVAGGVTLSAESVEAILRAHPAVADAVVCGLPDEEWGEVVAAVLSGQETDIAPWCREHLEPAARPKRVLWVEGLPLLGNGKPDRKRVRMLLDDASG